MTTPTKKQAGQVWKDVCKAHGITIVNSVSTWQRLKRRAMIKALNKLAKKEGLDIGYILKTRTITTCWNGKTYILVNGPVGEKSQLSGTRQLELLGHELMHAIDFGGDVKKIIRYLGEEDYLRYIEVRGEVAGADVRWGLSQSVYAAGAVFDAAWQKAYMTTSKTRTRAQAEYNELLEAYNLGHYASDSGPVVLAAIRKNIK